MKKQRPRVIPILLIQDEGLVKTVRFSEAKYIGDPINAVRIFNDSEVDELIVLDISREAAERGPRFDLLSQLTDECFMPLCYGGGVRTMSQVEKLFSMGIEKVSFNTALHSYPDLIKATAERYGSQAVVASIDVKKSFFSSDDVYTEGARKKTSSKAVDVAKKAEALGVGEILITSVDCEGTQKGYDLQLTAEICKSVNVPVIAHGGAGSLMHVFDVIKLSRASAAAAGSLFVYHGKLNGILINYPTQQQLQEIFRSL